MQSTLLFMLEGKHKKTLDKFKTEKNLVKNILTLNQYTYQYKYQKTKLNSYKNLIKTDFPDNELSPEKSYA